ncbi:MAG: OsmC family protein [Anaerolineales bacterium]|jgi:uncharacterized OsmC-like protein
MPEKIMMRLNKDFEGGFWAVDPSNPDSDHYQPVQAIYDISPYGMLLASLAGCTAQIVHTFAKNHSIEMDEIEIKLRYQHPDEEPEPSEIEGSSSRHGKITEQIQFIGDLSNSEKDKLFQVAQHCPIENLLEDGIIIKSQPVKD